MAKPHPSLPRDSSSCPLPHLCGDEKGLVCGCGQCSVMVKAGRLHVALSYPSIPYPRQTLPSSVWKPLQRLPSQAEALADAGPACPSHCQVFTCSVCRETFRRRMELRVHMVSHTGEMPYKVRPRSPPGWGCGSLCLGWYLAPLPRSLPPLSIQ